MPIRLRSPTDSPPPTPIYGRSVTTGPKAFIDNLVLHLDQRPTDVSFSVHYDINWTDFDQITNLRYREVWRLLRVDPDQSRTVWTGPVADGGVCANGQARTSRTHCGRSTWAELDLDPKGPGGLAASVELIPLLPEARTARSPEVDLPG